MGIFTKLADIVVYQWVGFTSGDPFGASVHFFVEDTTKIFAMLFVLIYVIAFARASVNADAVRNYLTGKKRFVGYILAGIFGAVTPFCSCSSIPLFIGFTQARIPVGITMAFLVTSPLISEIAVILLGSVLGVKFMVTYIVVGMIAGVIAGMFFDAIKAERFLMPIATEPKKPGCACAGEKHATMTMQERHVFAKDEMFGILKKIWLWVLIGVGVGAGLHGYVPEDYISKTFGGGEWWTVPAVVLFGIPLYGNGAGIVPVIESLILKGMPAGTALAFMMSVITVSIPEFIMLKQVMRMPLLSMFFAVMVALFTLVGWLFNAIY